VTPPEQQPADLGDQPRPVVALAVAAGVVVTVQLRCATPEMAEAYQQWLLTRTGIRVIHEEFGEWVDSGSRFR
jgi:hypothetical protein